MQAALDLIDRQGVDGFSMRKLGAELQVDPMAIYHYLPNKGALFDGVVELLWMEVPLDGLSPGESWAEHLASFMRRFRAVLRAHPRAVSIVGTRPAVTPAMLGLLDRAFGQLTGAGLSSIDAIDLVNCLAAYTTGHVLAEVGEAVGGDEIEPDSFYHSLDPETYPHLVAAFSEGYEYDPDGQFEHGLQAMLQGWELRLGDDDVDQFRGAGDDLADRAVLQPRLDLLGG